MVNNIILSLAQKGSLSAIKATERTVADVTQRLASGLKVNSAIDDPQNFFTARALKNRARDLYNLLDGIGNNIRTIQTALHGLEATESFLNQAEAIALRRQSVLLTGSSQSDEIIPLSSQILDQNPAGYWRLNDIGATAVNAGTGDAAIDGTYSGNVTQNSLPLYDFGASGSADFDGLSASIDIPDSALINLAPHSKRTVELVFNADTTAGRQVLYEEGATVNGLTIYIDNGLIRVSGEDSGSWIDADISAPITAGTTYHVAFVFDQVNNSFKGYLNGVEMGSVSVANAIFPTHGGNISIGGVNEGAQFHDGETDVNAGFYFDGRISDVALYNDALSAQEILSHALAVSTEESLESVNSDFRNILEQIDNIAIDAHYRGVNLLNNDNLVTFFNQRHTSLLITEAVDFTSNGLGLLHDNFESLSDIENMLFLIREARGNVRQYALTLRNDLAIISTRHDFTKESINTHLAGADDLTVADANKEGANLLALQTRQALSTTSLSLASQSQSQILSLF